MVKGNLQCIDGATTSQLQLTFQCDIAQVRFQSAWCIYVKGNIDFHSNLGILQLSRFYCGCVSREWGQRWIQLLFSFYLWLSYLYYSYFDPSGSAEQDWAQYILNSGK